MFVYWCWKGHTGTLKVQFLSSATTQQSVSASVTREKTIICNFLGVAIRVAEPPDFWAVPAPAPDQNFGGSGTGPAPAPATLVLLWYYL